jgi:hypothetical protein
MTDREATARAAFALFVYHGLPASVVSTIIDQDPLETIKLIDEGMDYALQDNHVRQKLAHCGTEAPKPSKRARKLCGRELMTW